MGRTAAMQGVLEAIMPGSTADVKLGICPFCKTQIKQEDFKDELSKKEFTISGLCQKCQDEAFGGGEH